MTISKRTGLVRKRAACGSEFDYAGWKAWGAWRQGATRSYPPLTNGGKNCAQDCAYPSECRWGGRRAVERPVGGSQYVAFSPAAASTTPPAPAPETGTPRSALFLEKLIVSAERKSARAEVVLSPVSEEEETHEHERLPDLEFPALVLDPKDSDCFADDTLMSDSDSESGSDSDGAQSEESAAVERIVECAGADGGFVCDELSPMSPGRRNAWDWSVEVLGGRVVLGEELLGDERVDWGDVI